MDDLIAFVSHYLDQLRGTNLSTETAPLTGAACRHPWDDTSYSEKLAGDPGSTEDPTSGPVLLLGLHNMYFSIHLGLRSRMAEYYWTFLCALKCWYLGTQTREDLKVPRRRSSVHLMITKSWSS